MKPKKSNPSHQKTNKIVLGAQKTNKPDVFEVSRARPGLVTSKTLGLFCFFGTSQHLVSEMDCFFFVLQCLFGVCNVKPNIYRHRLFFVGFHTKTESLPCLLHAFCEKVAFCLDCQLKVLFDDNMLGLS